MALKPGKGNPPVLAPQFSRQLLREFSRGLETKDDRTWNSAEQFLEKEIGPLIPLLDETCLERVQKGGMSALCQRFTSPTHLQDGILGKESGSSCLSPQRRSQSRLKKQVSSDCKARADEDCLTS